GGGSGQPAGGGGAAGRSPAADQDWDESQRIADLAIARGLLEPSQLRFLQKLHSDLSNAGSHKSLFQVLEAANLIEPPALTALREEVRASKPQRLGDYELLAHLGQGATGQVYRAKHVAKGFEAALRVLSPALVGDAAFLDRFLAGGRAAAKLDHPHLVRTLEVGDVQGTYFLVSEIVEGESLEQSVVDHGPLADLEALQVAEHLLLALSYIHQVGVQHLNIRPENVLLDRARKITRLADTGHAKPPVRRDQMRGADPAADRPTYVAPEQLFTSLPGDARSDLYSVGACIYFALTGKPPLTSLELARLSLDRGVSFDPRREQPEVSSAAAQFVEWLMAWSPDKRPADAQEALKKLILLLAQMKTQLKKSSRVDVTNSGERSGRGQAARAGMEGVGGTASGPPGSAQSGPSGGPGGWSGAGAGAGDATASGGGSGFEPRRKSRRLASGFSAGLRNRTTVLAENDPHGSGRHAPVILPKYVFYAFAIILGLVLGLLVGYILVLLRH
ncbi:MAG: serine/threonine-protein kinase, partial [Planctomycetota bacterium]